MKTACLVVCLLCLTTVIAESTINGKSGEKAKPTKDTFDACGFCRNATALVKGGIAFQQQQVTRVGKAIDGLCDNLPEGVVATCHDYAGRVMGMFTFLYTTTGGTLDGFCEGTFQCPPALQQIFTENGIFETTCAICKRTMTQFVQTLSSEAVTATSARAITLFCQGPGRILGQEECVKRSMEFLGQSVQTTAGYLQPEVFCQITKACKAPGAEEPEEEEGPSPSEMELEPKGKVSVTRKRLV